MGQRAAAKRWVLSVLAGRPRPWRTVAALMAVTLVTLTCIGALLALPGPPQPLSVQLAVLVDAESFAQQVQRMAVFWSKTSTMSVLSGFFLAIDTLLFIPLYAGVLSGLRARSQPMPTWIRTAVRWRCWRWLLGAAVVADLAENGLTWLATQGFVHANALHYATLLKWACTLAMLIALAAIAMMRSIGAGPVSWRTAFRRLAETLRDAARYLWLYAIPLFMLFGGVAMLVGVPQTREIIMDLGDASAGPASRLTTLSITGVMLVIWIAASGFAFALVSKIDPLTPRDAIESNAGQAAILSHNHQMIVGLTALVATNAVLVRMSSMTGAALSIFIVVGCIGLWVVTAHACAGGFKALGLPRNPNARPVAWSSVALCMLAYVLIVTAWRILPTPKEADLRAWGLFQKPDSAWYFNPRLIEEASISFAAVAALTGALFMVALLLARRRSSGSRRLASVAFATGMLVWLYTAWSRLGVELLCIQAGTIVCASIALWLLTHRTTAAKYRAWQEAFYKKASKVFKQPKRFSRWVEAGMPGVFGSLGGNLFRGALGLVAVFFLLPHLGDAPIVAEAGTLAVVFGALSIWGLFAAWLLVYLPMSKGLGNWTIAPLVWLSVVSALPRADPHVDRKDNPTLLAAEAKAPKDMGNVGAPSLHQHFAAWRQLLPAEKNSPMFVVAAAGGGLRATYWTALLLAEMDDRTCGQFGRHVMAASGVSGGALGLALYAAQRRVWQSKPVPERCKPGRAAEMRRVLSGDFLAPIAASLLFSDGPLSFVPFISPGRDRTDALSRVLLRRWEQAFRDDPASARLPALPMRQALPALAASPVGQTEGPPDQAHPVLYLNATSVETGRRVIASNVSLGAIPADPLFYEERASRGTRLLTARTSLLDAAFHSARFPVISSAGKVLACTHYGSNDAAGVCAQQGGPPFGMVEWGHLLDGGYFENSGLETLGDVLQTLQHPAHASFHGAMPPVFFIAISNDAGTKTMCSNTPTPRVQAIDADPVQSALNRIGRGFQEANPTWRHDDAVDGLQATWQALLSVREARARLELDRVVQRVGCAYVLEWSLGQHLERGRRARGLGEDPEGKRDLREPALGWLLSANSMRRMDEGIARYADAFPFDQAACPAKGVPRPRGLLGATSDPDTRCPQ